MEMAAESGKLTSLDLVEVNPTLDLRNTTADLGVSWRCRRLGRDSL